MKRGFAVQAEAERARILSPINDISKDQNNTIILALILETLRAANVDRVATMAAIQNKEYPKQKD